VSKADEQYPSRRPASANFSPSDRLAIEVQAMMNVLRNFGKRGLPAFYAFWR